MFAIFDLRQKMIVFLMSIIFISVVSFSLLYTNRIQAANSPVNQYKIYLTLDDGPSSNTEKVLDILRANDIKATFFVIGQTDDY